MKRTLWVTACMVGLLPVSQAWSQQRGQQQTDPQRAGQQDQAQQNQRQQRAGQSQTDRRQQTQQQAEARRTVRGSAEQGGIVQPLATILALGNHAEIELGQLASEKTQNPQVKQFAQQMVEEHTQFLGKLKQFNPQVPDADRTQLRSAQATDRQGQSGATQTPQRDPSIAQAGGTRGTGEANTRRQGDVARTGFSEGAGSSQHQGELVSVIQDAAQQKLQMTKETLSKYEGQDFDMGYLSQQVHAHVGMLAHLNAMKGKGPSEFNELVNEGISTTNEHLQHAKQLAKQLEDKEGGVQGSQQQNQQRSQQQNQQRNQ